MRPSAQRRLPALTLKLLPMRNVRRAAEQEKMTAKIYAIMAVTTVLTFGTLVASYQLLFPPQSLFA